MYRALYPLLLLLLAGCAGMNPSSPENAKDPPQNGAPEETRVSDGEPVEETAVEETRRGARSVAARELSSGSFGQGRARPEVRVARSASELTQELGEEVRARGQGVYLAALWGRKSTGGYSVGLAGAREKGGRIVVRLSLKEPPRDAMVTQAITYPYVYVFVPGAAPENLTFTDEKGRELDWPVVEAGG
jgi:hypothetical protein